MRIRGFSFPFWETVRFAHGELKRNWRRAVLTSLGMVVGTASLILVVTTGITGRAYIMEQIRGVGSNLIYAHLESSATAENSRSLSDSLTVADLAAIQQLTGVRHAAPVILDYDAIDLDNTVRQVTMIGTNPAYQAVRNIEVVEGRFIDDSDLDFRSKVCVVTPLLSRALQRNPFYRGYLNFYGLRFTVIGVFRERVDTYGQTEVSDYSAILPLSVIRFFKESGALDQIYISADDRTMVPEVTTEVQRLLESRHGGQKIYRVENLAGILEAANRISLGLTLVLLIIAAISLVSSGIGIMNVMLIAVTERTREIGIKKAVGASRRTLLLEVLSEALMLSLGGGTLGILVGIAIPFSVHLFMPAIRIQIPILSVLLGFAATILVGLTFGMMPAMRAARLHPAEALRYE